jgi:hypothetical protein
MEHSVRIGPCLGKQPKRGFGLRICRCSPTIFPFSLDTYVRHVVALRSAENLQRAGAVSGLRGVGSCGQDDGEGAKRGEDGSGVDAGDAAWGT